MSFSGSAVMATFAIYHTAPIEVRDEAFRVAYAALNPICRSYIDEMICNLIERIKAKRKETHFSENNALELLGALAIFLLEEEADDGHHGGR